MNTSFRISLIFFLIWALVFFTASEASLFSLGRLRLQKLKEEGHPRHTLIERLLSNPRKLITSLLIGNEMVNVAVSSLTSAVFISLWGDAAKWAAIPVVTFLILLFGEVIPKSLAVRHPERIAPPLSPLVERFVALVGPFRWGIQKIIDGIFALFRIKTEAPSPFLTEEVFKNLIEAGEKEGTLEESEKHFIHRVFKFGDQTVKNIMVPRPEVFALPGSTSLEDALEFLRTNRFSRIPVYGKNERAVIGVLYAKDLLGSSSSGKKSLEGGLRSILHKPYFIPLSKKVDDLLRDFQRQRIHFAVVVDEYGGMAGIVTLEDLLEELFGEIYDELDAARDGASKRRGTSYPGRGLSTGGGERA